MLSNPTMLVAGALACGLLAAGCSKPNDNSVAGKPVAAKAADAAVVAPENESPLTRDLQASVDAYVKIYQRKPASLEQMVKEGFLATMPAAPPGKRYAYDSSTARVSVEPR